MDSCTILLQLWILFLTCKIRPYQACECGRTSNDRIYNGHPVSSSEYPWMVRLYSLEGNTLRLCGATMISTLYAVTAGHCAPKADAAKSYLIFGSRSYSSVIYRESPNVEQFIVYPRETRGQDIALVKLKKSVNVVPICLPPLDESFAGVRATILGYGQTETGSTSRSLLAGDVFVPSNAQCGRVQRVYSTEICGGNFGGDPAICKGDSGGPMMYYDDETKRWIIIGVISSTYGCSNTYTFGIFTRVSSYESWIQQKSNNAGCQI